MKISRCLCCYIFFLAACTGETKLPPQDEQKVRDQVIRDQAAMDSMEAVIQQQIDAISDDSLMNVDH